MATVETYFKRYEYLAESYAHRVRLINRQAMELNDVKQELKIKLFLSIKSYARKCIEYRKTGRMKPIPIEFYLRTVMSHEVADIVRSMRKIDTVDMSLLYDLSIGHDTLEISKTDIKLGFQSLSDLFEDKKQKRYMKIFFIYNFDIKKVFQFSKKEHKYEKELEVKLIVNDGLEKIRKYLQQ